MRGAITRRLSVGFAVFGSLLVGLLIAFNDVNQAKAWPFTSGEHIGFFTGTPDSFGSFVIAEGLSATTGAGLITQVRNALYNTGGFTAPQDDIGAAFIVLTMLGCVENGCGVTGAADGIATAKSRFAEWSSIITQYASAGLISNINFTYVRNTYSQDVGSHDVAWYTPAGGAQTDPAIVFRSATTGAIIYAIKHECGNPVGNVNRLPPLSWSLTGSTTVSSATATPGQTVSFTHRITNTGDATATGWVLRMYWMPPTPGIAVETPRTPITAGGSLASGATRTAVSPYTIPGTANPGDRYCQRVGYDPVDNDSPPTRNGRGNTACVTVTGWSLSGTSSVSAAAARPGTAVTFSHVIRNTGNMTVNAAQWTWRLYWEPPTPGHATEGNVTSVGGCTASGGGSTLAPNATVSHNCNFTIPAGATNASQYCMAVGFDPADNQVPATRNGRSTKICVTVHVQPAAVCTNSVSPNPAEEGMTVTVNMGATQQPGSFPVNPATATIVYTITGPMPVISGTQSVGIPVNPGLATYARSIASAVAGVYTVSYTVRAGAGLDSYAATTPTPCTFTFNVTKNPYFKVYSGDAAAGASFMTAGSCAAPPAGSVISAFNKGGAGYPGGGAQISAIAMGAISGFTSTSFGTSGSLPKGLTFANTGGGTYGGSFGGGLCIPDYWSLTSVTGAPAVLAGPRAIGATTLASGTKQDVFVNGDVYINGNIAYSGSGSWSVNTIPYFRLIVRGGNIYISGSVTELSGMYVAIPSGGSGGAIYTCAPAGGLPISEAYMSNPGNCGNKLTVYGAFIAKTVKLLRTYQTLQDATTASDNRQPDGSAASNTNNAAEVFVYAPEVWIGVPQTLIPTSMTYSGLTNLPPVL